MRFLLPVGLMFLVMACGNTGLNFLNMSEEELYAYNAEQPVMDQVVCRKEARTSSFIRKKRCQTVRQIIYELENAMLALDVLSYDNYSVFGSQRD